jgi:predicted translin family RNA/ssDNA-binding protein
MPGPVQRDSWGRCEQPSMLYDTIRNPYARHIPPKPVVKTDTIESTQQRLNRQIFERLQNGGLRLPHESYVAVVQVGKFLVLAIMLPPYLLVYGLPRWILVSALPQIFLGIKNEMLRMGRFLFEISKQIADIMKGILEQMLGDALKMARHQARNFFGLLSKNLQKAVAFLNRLKAGWLEKKNSLKEAAVRLPIEVFQKTQRILSKVKHHMLQWFEKSKEKAASTVLRASIWTDQNVLTPVINAISSPLLLAAEKISKKARAFSSKVHRQVRRILDPAVSVFNRAKKALEERRKKISLKVSRALEDLQEKVEDAKKMLKRLWKTATSPMVEAADIIRNKIQQAAASVSEYAKQFFISLPASTLQGAVWAWNSLPAGLRRSVRRGRDLSRRWGRSMKGMGQAVGNGIREFYRMRKSVQAYVMKGIGWLGRLLANFLLWLKRQTVTLPKKIGALIVMAWKGSKKAFSKTIYSIRLLVAFSWAIGGYIRILAKELIAELDSWIYPVK